MELPSWAVAAVITALPVRMVADLLVTPSGPLHLGAVLTVVWTGLLAVVAWRGRAALAGRGLLAPLLLVAVLLAVGALRAPNARAGLAGLVRLGSPFLLLAAAAALPPRQRDRFLQAPLVTGLSVVGIAGVFLLAGQPGWFQHDGIGRLLGPYANIHSHALAEALLLGLGAVGLLAPWSSGWRRASGLLAVGAAAALWLTYVRTAAVVGGITVVGVLWLDGRRGWALAVAALGIAAALLAPTWSERSQDVVAVATLREPTEGWASLGRYRPAIWRNSLVAFAEQPAGVWLLGNGLGGHLVFWKPRDPHNEVLSLLYQLGVLGPVAWGWALVAAVRGVLPRRADADRWTSLLASWALALSLAAAAGSLVSNTFVARVLPAWWLWGVLGLALIPSREAR